MKFFTFFIAIFFCTNSFAGSQTGKIKRVYVRDDNLIYIVLEGVGVDKPACARNTYWMIRDENSVGGKAQFSMVLAAQASGKSVEIVGKHDCTRWSDGEDIAYIMIGEN